MYVSVTDEPVWLFLARRAAVSITMSPGDNQFSKIHFSGFMLMENVGEKRNQG